MSTFQQIFEFLQAIPSGKVVTYKFLAQKFHSHPRAIARILASNMQQDIYPCYKVIRSDGLLGGYNLGIAEKIHRLENDGVVIKNNKIENTHIYDGH